MTTYRKVGFAVAATSLVLASVASAQSKDEAVSTSRSSELPSAHHNLELTLSSGYAQAFGNVASGRPSFTDVGSAGGAVQIGVGYRVIPQLTLGVYTTGSMYSRGDQIDASSKVYSASAGVQADLHFLPQGERFDPWVSLGTGWRGYWIAPDQGTTALHGLELGKLQAGVDYRIDRAFSVGPVVGADMSIFLTESTPANTKFRDIPSPEVNTFVFAGLQGRFDIPMGGTTTTQVADADR